MAKMIEAKAVISGDDKLSPLIDKIGKKFDHLAKGMKSAEAVDKMAGALEKVRSQIAAIEKFNASKIKFFGSRDELKAAQANLERHAKTMASLGSGANTKAAAAEQARLAAVVDRASRSFDQQRNAVFSARRALVDMGVPVDRAAAHQQKLAAAVDRTNNALDRQNKRAARRANVAQNAAIGLGMLGVGYRARSFAGKAITSAAEFDYATRKQRELTEGNISVADQAAILSPQAKRIGQETRFTNLDVVQAQTASMQGLPTGLTGRDRAEVGAGMMEHVKNYAIVMETDLKQAAETVRTYLQTTGKDISTKEKALRESQLAVNRIVRMAKLGGMSADDVPQYLKFGAGANSVVGVDEDAYLAIGALAKRGGLPGQEAGVFMRQVAGKLAAPTKKGLTAMRAAGIDYNKFVRMPGHLDVGRLESQFEQDIGVKFTPAVRARLATLLADKSVIGDRNKFTEAVTSAVSPVFPTTKKGTMAASDKAKIAKAAGSFHAVSGQGVDAQGLLDTLMQSPLTLQQINSILDYRQGGRFAVTQRQRDEYVASRQMIRDTDNDPNFAKKKADEIMGGLGGSLENLKGSFENLALSIGQANEGILKFSFDKIGLAFDWVSNLSTEGRQAATALGAIAAVGSAGFIMKQLFSGFGLQTSAAALDGAAVALTRAAVLLGGSKAADLPSATKGGGKSLLSSAWNTTKSGVGIAGGAIATYAPTVVPPALVLGGVAATTYGIYEDQKPYAGLTGKERNRVRRSGGVLDDVMRRQFNDDREARGLPPLENGPLSLNGIRSSLGMEPVTAELKGSAEVKGEAKVTIEIPGLANRTVGVPLRGTLHTNGPGSLGVSSPDASAMPIGVP